MQNPKLDLETLAWQLELLVEPEPEIIGKTLQELGTYLSAAEPEKQAREIVSHFLRTGFDGLGYIFVTLEAEFRKNTVGPVVDEIFKSWEVFKLALAGGTPVAALRGNNSGPDSSGAEPEQQGRHGSGNQDGLHHRSGGRVTMTRTSAAEVRKPKFVSRGEKPLPSGGGSSPAERRLQ